MILPHTVLLEKCVDWLGDCYYFHQSAFLSTDDVDHVNWDAHHGRAGKQGTDEMTPPGIVVVEVFQFLKFDNVEEENALIDHSIGYSGLVVVARVARVILCFDGRLYLQRIWVGLWCTSRTWTNAMGSNQSYLWDPRNSDRLQIPMK